MGFVGVEISKAQSTGGKPAVADNTGLLVIGGAPATSSLPALTAKRLLSVDDAVALGIDPSYDDTNNILAYHHIDEFFRVAPEGNLYILLDDGNLTTDFLKSVLRANQDISFVGFVRNGSQPSDFTGYVTAYQQMVDDLRAEGRYVASVIVEGDRTDSSVLIGDYPDMRAIGADNVSVVIAQDPVIRNIKQQYESYAAIGTVMGSIAVRKVNENIGSVDIERKPPAAKGRQDYPLTDAAKGRWLSAVLQSGKDVNELSPNEIRALNDKGYLFVGFYNGYAGMYWNDSHTATAASSDYAHIENNRVWAKAAVIVRQTLLPKVKSNVDKDPHTGKIAASAATELEKLAEKALGYMVAEKEASGVGVYIDPDQTLADNQPLEVKIKVVMNGIVHEFAIELALTEKL